MKNSVFFTIVLIAAFVAGWVIFEFFLPEFVKEGGYLVVLLVALTLMVGTFVIERILSLRKAAGRRSYAPFLRDVLERTRAGDIQGAIDLCDKQGGTMAGVLGSGLRRYQAIADDTPDKRIVIEEVEHAIDEATALEAPSLERNLVALSTIASIATMVGLLGTVIGMIRAFAALAAGGSVDAVQLSLGISEALINTAGGLVAAIIAIVAYNYFTTKIDGLTHSTEEAAAALVQSLGLRAPSLNKGAMRNPTTSSDAAPDLAGPSNAPR
ncbi:MAG TPA: MotA/TolQ/ExbB proton channel family protein [Rhodothermales bacterium]|nr:MotA/TolQ/ExbB proton channel family protein [Rhodothermales bacterium]